ncbi:MAG: hypothetical protein AB1768_03055 [Pseudomonadota bacterium]|jgi:hypothetical protein
MLLTKEGAEKKWCPLARSEYDSACKCIADGCATWRWSDHVERRIFVAENVTAEAEGEAGPKPAHCEGWEFCPFETDPAGWVEPIEEAEKRRRGYCGLAGMPSL